MFKTNSNSSSNQVLDPAMLAEARRLELRTKRAIDADTIGNFRSSFKGTGLTFAELREYEPGDDVRRIDWKASARSNRTYAKSYVEERSLSVIIALDCSRSTQFGFSESSPKRRPSLLARSFAALITLIARHSGDEIGLVRFSDRIEGFLAPNRKRSQVQKVINALLAEQRHDGTTDINLLLRELTTRIKRRSVIFIVSDFFAPPFQETLRALSARHDVICAQLCSAGPGIAPNLGLVEVEDAESGERLVVDTSSADGQLQLTAALSKHADEIRRVCRTAGADWIPLKDNPATALRELMSRRNRSTI